MNYFFMFTGKCFLVDTSRALNSTVQKQVILNTLYGFLEFIYVDCGVRMTNGSDCL
jgi:hypothetical protein